MGSHIRTLPCHLVFHSVRINKNTVSVTFVTIRQHTPAFLAYSLLNTYYVGFTKFYTYLPINSNFH